MADDSGYTAVDDDGIVAPSSSTSLSVVPGRYYTDTSPYLHGDTPPSVTDSLLRVLDSLASRAAESPASAVEYALVLGGTLALT